jgi:hypothetical protein
LYSNKVLLKLTKNPTLTNQKVSLTCVIIIGNTTIYLILLTTSSQFLSLRVPEKHCWIHMSPGRKNLFKEPYRISSKWNQLIGHDYHGQYYSLSFKEFTSTLNRPLKFDYSGKKSWNIISREFPCETFCVALNEILKCKPKL